MFGNARRGVSYLREDVTVINTRSPLFFKDIKHVFWPSWHQGRNVYTSRNQTIIQIVCFPHSYIVNERLESTKSSQRALS